MLILFLMHQQLLFISHLSSSNAYKLLISFTCLPPFSSSFAKSKAKIACKIVVLPHSLMPTKGTILFFKSISNGPL